MKTLNQILSRLRDLNYKIYESGNYNLNIVGIRNRHLNTNTFNDELHCIFKLNEVWIDKHYQITTDPGFKSLQNPQNSKGCSILVPNQYLNCYKLGYHKGQYIALVQCKPVQVYRDNNKDKIMDLNPKSIDNGVFGINIHKAGSNSNIVEDWSAGCQAFKRKSDYDEFISLCIKSSKLYSNSFTYTLLDDFD